MSGLPERDGTGAAVAEVALAVTELPAGRVRCAVDGFGALGRGVAAALTAAGASVTAVSDAGGCAADPAGLDVTAMLATPPQRPVRAMHAGRASLPRRSVAELPADILVLTAGPGGALDAPDVARCAVPVVVLGVPGSLTTAALRELAARRIRVVMIGVLAAAA